MHKADCSSEETNRTLARELAKCENLANFGHLYSPSRLLSIIRLHMHTAT
jgi:hypothetical protein